MAKRFLIRAQSADAVLDAITVAVVCLDRDLTVTYMNSAAEALFRTSVRHVKAETLDQALPYLAGLQARLQEALDTGDAYREHELELNGLRGEALVVDFTVTPQESGLLLELRSLDRELRISRDDQLLTQHEISRELVRSLAHEIKNPLGGLRGAAQLLERELSEARLTEYTQVIIQEADRLQRLVDRLLGPNRPPDKQRINIHEALEHCRQLLQAELPDGVHLLRDYDPSIPETQVDREQLIQALLNILRNAAAAVEGNGHILLRTRTRRQVTIGAETHRLAVQIDVIDDGPGIPPELQERIFYPLVTSREDGTGLGLSIAQYLVHANGGMIECDSQPGDTVFSLILPLETEDGD